MLNPNQNCASCAGRPAARPSAAMGVALRRRCSSPLPAARYAAVTLPRHSVGATQLKSFAVTNPKLAANAVGSRKIMPGAVGFYRVNRKRGPAARQGTCATRPGDHRVRRHRRA